jgi:hypothetical protein
MNCDTLERLGHFISEEEVLRDSIREAAAPSFGLAFGALAAAGERASTKAREYELVVESVLEGYLLHYARGRVVDPSDPDLRLLCGDYLYAFGLSRLARLGDLEAVGELADLISLCAQVHATPVEEASPSPRRTGGLWSIAALAIASGPWPEHEDAKRAARDGDPEAGENAHRVATDRARKVGVEPQLKRALIAFERALAARLTIS